MADGGRDAAWGDLEFEPNGREPELPGYDDSRAPMLGGRRRLWPSVAAYLLSEQHRAHRRGDMERVWNIRRLRSRLQVRHAEEREDSYLRGERVLPLTDADALAEIRVERQEVVEALEQCRRWLRLQRAAELEASLAVIDEVLEYWEGGWMSREARHCRNLDRLDILYNAISWSRPNGSTHAENRRGNQPPAYGG